VTLLGVDIGGTFTDFVALAGDRVRAFKRLSDRTDPARVVIAGAAVLALGGEDLCVHGSTIATNALLERRGARAAFVTTRGFRDALTIGRQTRPALYALHPERPAPLIPRERCFEVTEHVCADGAVVIPLVDSELPALIDALRKAEVESVAVGLLFSFLRPEHEARVGAALRAAGIAQVTLSHELLSTVREYERFSTTAANAFVSPLVGRYLTRLAAALPCPLRVLQSNGGRIGAERASREGVRMLLSGPAGGVAGAFHLAGLAGEREVITLDMGGTSTDVALCPGTIEYTTETEVGGVPVGLPSVRVESIGAGGGSIARVDAGGALRVGPESAGADPGPACFGRGDECTVTDAQVVLGRIPADAPLAESVTLDAERARRAVARVADAMRCGVDEAALAIVRVANHRMAAAIRAVSLRRGIDPRPFTLVAFGGGGPLHACELADLVGLRAVLVPPWPGMLSALGLALSDLVLDYSQSVLLPVRPGVEAELRAHLDRLAAQAQTELRDETPHPERARFEPALDVRYRGQSYELTVPFASDSFPAFHDAHQRAYGHSHPEAPAEVVTVRLRAVVPTAKPAALTAEGEELSEGRVGDCRVVTEGGAVAAPVLRRGALPVGERVAGPAVLLDRGAGAFIPHGWMGTPHPSGNFGLVRL